MEPDGRRRRARIRPFHPAICARALKDPIRSRGQIAGAADSTTLLGIQAGFFPEIIGISFNSGDLPAVRAAPQGVESLWSCLPK